MRIPPTTPDPTQPNQRKAGGKQAQQCRVLVKRATQTLVYLYKRYRLAPQKRSRIRTRKRCYRWIAINRTVGSTTVGCKMTVINKSCTHSHFPKTLQIKLSKHVVAKAHHVVVNEDVAGGVPRSRKIGFQHLQRRFMHG